MVKSDVRNDYYADLGLSPSAEAEDVKRQFRKLGELNGNQRLKDREHH
jgi:curved DNA-binding protein CbpA